MDYLGKGEVHTNTDLNTFVNKIWEKYTYCVHRKSLRFFYFNWKWERKQNCCVYAFVQCSLLKKTHVLHKPTLFKYDKQTRHKCWVHIVLECANGYLHTMGTALCRFEGLRRSRQTVHVPNMEILISLWLLGQIALHYFNAETSVR